MIIDSSFEALQGCCLGFILLEFLFFWEYCLYICQKFFPISHFANCTFFYFRICCLLKIYFICQFYKLLLITTVLDSLVIL